MRKTIGFLVGLFIAASVACAGPDAQTLTITDVITNATATVATSGVTNTVLLDGYVDAIIVDLGGTESSPDIDIDVGTVGGTGGGPTKVLYSADDVTADAIIYLRIPAETTADGAVGANGNAVKVPLYQDNWYVRAYDANTNAGINLTVHLLFSRSTP